MADREFDADKQLASFEEDVGFTIDALADMLQSQSDETKEENWQKLSKGKREVTSFAEIYTILFGLVALTLTAKQLSNQPSKSTMKALTFKLLPKLPKSDNEENAAILSKTCFITNLHDLLREIHSETQTRRDQPSSTDGAETTKDMDTTNDVDPAAADAIALDIEGNDKPTEEVASTEESKEDDSDSAGTCALLVCGALCMLVCLASAIYGLYAGNELDALWSKYTPDQINTECDGQYTAEFTFKENGKRRDWGGRFVGMIVVGSMQAALYVIVPLFMYACHKGFCCNDSNYSSPKALGTYVCFFQIAFVLGWFFVSIQCLQFYNRVQKFCDEGSEIYEGTMDIFDWFYPLVIFEIVKGSIVFCIACAFCAWARLCSKK